MEQTITPATLLRSLDDAWPWRTEQNEDSDRMPDILTASQFLVLARDYAVVNARFNRRVLSVRKFLATQQRLDGHWERLGDDWHMSVTAWTVIALTSAETSARSHVLRGAKWMADRQDDHGGFIQSDVTPIANSYCTSYATAALFLSTGASSAVVRGVERIRTLQNRDGGFGDAYAYRRESDPSLTAYVAHALTRLPSGMATDSIARGAEFIASSQRATGAWPLWTGETDSVEATAAALRVLMMSPRRYNKQIADGMAYLMNHSRLSGLEYWSVISIAYAILESIR